MRGIVDYHRYDRLSRAIAQLFAQDEGLDVLEEAEEQVAASRQKFGSHSEEYIQSLSDLTFVHFDLNDLVQAERTAKRALGLLKASRGRKHSSVVNFINNLAEAYIEIERYDLAEPFCHEAMELAADSESEKDLNRATAQRNMGVLHMKRGDYDAAQKLFTKAMATRQKAAGMHNLDTYQSFEDLTMLNHLREALEEAVYTAESGYSVAGRLFDADTDDWFRAYFFMGDAYIRAGYGQDAYDTLSKAYERAREVFGSDDGMTIDIRLKLARVCELLHRYSDAETHFLNSTRSMHRMLGGDHPILVDPLCEVSRFFRARGDYIKAESHLMRAFACSRLLQLVDEKSSDMLLDQGDDIDSLDESDAWSALYNRTAESLGELYRPFEDIISLWNVIGKRSKRDGLLHHLKIIVREHISPDSPGYARALYLIGQGSLDAGRRGEAIEWFRRAHEYFMERKGETSVEALAAHTWLADATSQSGALDEADLLFNDLVAKSDVFREKAAFSSGRNQVVTTQPLFEMELDRVLARHLFRRGQHKEAEKRMRQLLRRMEDSVLYKVENEAGVFHDIGVILRGAKQWAKSMKSFEEALFMREARLGPDNLQVADSLHEMGKLYAIMSQEKTAEEFLKRAFTIRQRALVFDHEAREVSAIALGELYHHQENFDTAAEMHISALKMRSKRVGGRHKSLPTQINRIARSLSAAGKTDKASEYLTSALQITEAAYGKDDPRTLEQQQTMETILNMSTSDINALSAIDRR